MSRKPSRLIKLYTEVEDKDSSTTVRQWALGQQCRHSRCLPEEVREAEARVAKVGEIARISSSAWRWVRRVSCSISRARKGRW